MSGNGLSVGSSGIEIPALELATGMPFQTAGHGRFMPLLQELAPRIVLINCQEGHEAMVADIRAVRAVSNVAMMALVPDELAGIDALRLGADGIVPLPVDHDELVLKIGVLLRLCGEPKVASMYGDGVITVDRLSRTVVVDGGAVTLTPTEFRMFSALVERDGAVVGHRQLRDSVWGDPRRDLAEVKLYVSYLRRKFAKVGVDPFETVRGIGYRYCPRPIGP